MRTFVVVIKRTQIVKYLPFIVLSISVLLKVIAVYLPNILCYIYPLWVYKFVSQSFSFLFSLLPFSFAELLLLLLPMWCLYRLGKGLYLWLSHKAYAGTYWRDVWRRSWVFTCCLLSVFILSAGVNYHRTPLSDYVGLSVQQIEKEELMQLCSYLSDLTNKSVQYTNRSREGRFISSHSFTRSRTLVGDAYDSLSQLYPACKGRYPSSKPLIFSRWVSYTHIMGFFFPFTFEANINKDIPDFMIPAVIAHEQAHLRGFMREEEAEYAVFLLARFTDDAELQYAFYLSSLMRAMNTLYSVDKELYGALVENFSDLLMNDLNSYADYWSAFRSPVGTLSQTVNDFYLKANSQSEGVQSYSRVVALLIADFKKIQTNKIQEYEND